MKINGKVHCFFEQSGTFKNEFIKLGIPAEDYDIQNNFGQTDHVMDLFKAIGDAYDGKPSLFDAVTKDDLIIAFFPCIYFETIQMLDFALSRNGTLNKPIKDRVKYAIDRLHKRTHLHELLYKLTYTLDDRGIRWILENPATTPNYLITGQNFPTPTIIEKNRSLRGDYFRKPTAYWFFGCTPTTCASIQPNHNIKIINKCERSHGDGLCGGERSMLSPDYARNFICDFILGGGQTVVPQQRDMFDELEK